MTFAEIRGPLIALLVLVVVYASPYLFANWKQRQVDRKARRNSKRRVREFREGR